MKGEDSWSKAACLRWPCKKWSCKGEICKSGPSMGEYFCCLLQVSFLPYLSGWTRNCSNKSRFKPLAVWQQVCPLVPIFFGWKRSPSSLIFWFHGFHQRLSERTCFVHSYRISSMPWSCPLKGLLQWFSNWVLGQLWWVEWQYRDIEWVHMNSCWFGGLLSRKNLHESVGVKVLILKRFFLSQSPPSSNEFFAL